MDRSVGRRQAALACLTRCLFSSRCCLAYGASKLIPAYRVSVHICKKHHIPSSPSRPLVSLYAVWSHGGDISRFYVEDFDKYNDSPGALLFPIFIHFTMAFCQIMSETQFLLKMYDQSELLIYQADYGIDYGTACGESMGPCIEGYVIKVILLELHALTCLHRLSISLTNFIDPRTCARALQNRGQISFGVSFGDKRALIRFFAASTIKQSKGIN